MSVKQIRIWWADNFGQREQDRQSLHLRLSLDTCARLKGAICPRSHLRDPGEGEG